VRYTGNPDRPVFIDGVNDDPFGIIMLFFGVAGFMAILSAIAFSGKNRRGAI
jgi:hypothetical protein